MKVALLLATALLVGACSEGEPPRTAANANTNATMKSPPSPSSCPLGVDGARIVYEDIDGGARLTLTAPPDKLDDLRRRARDAAAIHGPGQHLGEGHEGHHAMGDNHGLKAMQMPPATGSEQDLEGGARIDLVPRDPADLDALRAKARTRARELMASCN